MENFRDLSNCLRILSADMVEKANSGHPGMPLGFADVMTVLVSKFLRFYPKNPKWFNRDRLILSAGHGSALLYSFYYLAGYKDFDLDDLRKFRQIHSKTPGHPEYGIYDAIEATTGPLGQGFGTSIGSAIACKKYQDYFKNYGNICDYKVYCIVGDGCLMEGISYEAASLAGHLGLNNLIVLFDDNNITIDGSTDLAVSEDHIAKFKSLNWDAYKVDGHNYKQIHDAIADAQNSDKPTFIACKTKIGYGSKNKVGSEVSHGSPLGKDEIEYMKREFGFPNESFKIPDNLIDLWRKIGQKNEHEYDLWMNEFSKLTDAEKNYINPPHIEKDCLHRIKSSILDPLATRNSSSFVVEKLLNSSEKIIVGSADLSSSNCLKTKSCKTIAKNDFSGNFIHYGTREALMGAISNGLAIENFLSICGTFLVFSDYMRPSIRLSALMKLQVIYVMTHDSIGVGEDGPTHQPIEHLCAFRSMPNIFVMRPADYIESIECFEIGLASKNKPSMMVFSRQKINQKRKYDENYRNLSTFGGYVIHNPIDNADLVLVGTGSEVDICLEIKEIAINDQKNLRVKVISVPCVELFLTQDIEYKKSTLSGENVVFIEAGSKNGLLGIMKYVNAKNKMVFSIDEFGISGKAEHIFDYFEFNGQSMYNYIKKYLQNE